MIHPLHHLHKRKIIYKKLEKYPHTDLTKSIFDKIIYIMAVLSPIMTIPQSYNIWTTKSAINMSLITWLTYLIANIVWLIYGLLHKERPIVFMYSLALMVNSSVVLGIYIYS